jgi:hypothetical protein
MAERLSMSLDDIISQNRTQRKPLKKINNNNNKNNKNKEKKNVQVVKSSQHKQMKFQQKKSLQKIIHLEEDIQEDAGNARPLKMVTISRPKVITAEANEAPKANNIILSNKKNNSKNSVFQRLGSSGTVVTVSNLQASVVEGDVLELCSALGELQGGLKFSRDSQGLGVASVTFADESTARACVAKYNGVPLDGLPMQVKLEVKTVFSRLQPPTAVATTSTSSNNGNNRPVGSLVITTTNNNSHNSNNVKEGLFGTALPQPVGGRTVELQGTKVIHRKNNNNTRRGNNNNRNNNNRKQRQNNNDMDLDEDLDSYMAQR